jgi:hypothetical protein
MKLIDLSADEGAPLIKEPRDTIDHDRYPLSPGHSSGTSIKRGGLTRPATAPPVDC